MTLTMAGQPRAGSTPSARTGNLPVVGLCLLIIALFWVRSRAPG